MGPTNKDKELEKHARAALVQDWLPSDKDDKATYNAKKMTMLNIMAINNTLAIEDTRKDVHGVKAQSLEISTMLENLGKQYEAMEKAQKENQERMDQLGKLLEENKRFTEDTRRENQSLGEHVRDLVGQSARVENRVSTLFGNESGRIDALKTLIASLENRLENQAQRDEFKSEQFARLDERVKLVQELQMLAASAPNKSREVLDRIGDILEDVPQPQAESNEHVADQAEFPKTHDQGTQNMGKPSLHEFENDVQMDNGDLDEATIFVACGKYMNSVRWFNRQHAQKPPSGTQKHRFVRKFLESQTRRVAHYLQGLILSHFPNIHLTDEDSQKRVYGRNRIYLRINVNDITWEDVKTACNDGFDALAMARAQMADDQEQENKRRRWARQDEQSLPPQPEDETRTVNNGAEIDRSHGFNEHPRIKRRSTSNVPGRQWAGEASEL
ncbi:hypothetical protein E8E14_012360 [Neopestalotiopsis sp. 37M]|nr:hypothetical protein E8E14_012360 [Neopestalotiopsis sp. 37M]